MLKHTLAVAALFAFATPALAESWNVTEEGVSGIKVSQGTWDVKVDGGKVVGAATMQLNNGSPLSYKVDGTVGADGAYTIKMLDRTDGKNNCVWSAHSPSAGHGLIGDVACDGKKAMIVRAGILN